MGLVQMITSVSLLSVGITVIVAASSSIDCFNKHKTTYPQDIKPLHVSVLVIGIVQVMISLFLMYKFFKGGKSTNNEMSKMIQATMPRIQTTSAL